MTAETHPKTQKMGKKADQKGQNSGNKGSKTLITACSHQFSTPKRSKNDLLTRIDGRMPKISHRSSRKWAKWGVAMGCDRVNFLVIMMPGGRSRPKTG